MEFRSFDYFFPLKMSSLGCIWKKNMTHLISTVFHKIKSSSLYIPKSRFNFKQKMEQNTNEEMASIKSKAL